MANPRPAPSIEHVCAAFGLGHPTAPWTPIGGGLSNDLFRLETEDGVFAVQRMVAGVERAGFRAAVESSYAVEQAALRAGLSAPSPVEVVDSRACLARIECDNGSHGWVRVHEWVDGSVPDHRTIDGEPARSLGRLVAQLHRLDMPSASVEATEPAPAIGEERWTAVGERADESGVEWASTYRELIPTIVALDGRSTVQRPRKQVPGHRDADDKNALLSPQGRLYLIDWDAAGPTAAEWELTSLFLDWSSARTADPRIEIVHAIAEGYAGGGGPATNLDEASWIAAQLGWLHFNLERALGDHGRGAVALGQGELVFFWRQLPRISRSIDRWLDEWCTVLMRATS